MKQCVTKNAIISSMKSQKKWKLNEQKFDWVTLCEMIHHWIIALNQYQYHVFVSFSFASKSFHFATSIGASGKLSSEIRLTAIIVTVSSKWENKLKQASKYTITSIFVFVFKLFYIWQQNFISSMHAHTHTYKHAKTISNH